jgi:hypothetical protein
MMIEARPDDHLVDSWPPAITRVELHAAELPTGALQTGRSGGDVVAGTRGASTPLFAAPGLVLLAIAAIAAGYHWLRLIPAGAPRPIAVLLVVVVVPAAFGLTRRVSGPATGWICTVARSCAVLLPCLWTMLHISRSVVAADLLGAVCLALALSLVALAVLSEVAEHQPTGTH